MRFRQLYHSGMFCPCGGCTAVTFSIAIPPQHPYFSPIGAEEKLLLYYEAQYREADLKAIQAGVYRPCREQIWRLRTYLREHMVNLPAYKE